MEINPIQITEKSVPFSESVKLGELLPGYEENLYTEAVFTGGREKLKPIVDCIQKIQDELDYQTGDDKEGGTSRFNSKAFTKNSLWKDLELSIMDAFGFKNVRIMPSHEKYVGKGRFRSKAINVYTFCTWRYPIQGVVTDAGFFDKSRSIEIKIIILLGMLKLLTAEELLAVILHELGHNIDPAIVDIRYVTTNRVADYLIGKKSTRNKVPNLDNAGPSFGVMSIFKWFCSILALLMLPITIMISVIYNTLKTLFTSKTKLLRMVKDIVMKDKRDFSRNKNTEAFADNFARMYGYGPDLTSALSKMEDYLMGEARLSVKKSFILNEKERQIVIAEFIKFSVEDKHSTVINRAVALIKEYEEDLKDPDMPEKVKKNIKEDMESVKGVMDKFVNHKDEFIRNLRTMMYEELTKYGNPDEEDKK